MKDDELEATPAGGEGVQGEGEAYDKVRRRLLWSMPTGLYILGVKDQDKVHLMTTSWATQVATSPKIIAISVESKSKTAACLVESPSFVLALLPKSRRELIRKFVKSTQHVEVSNDRFVVEGVEFLRSAMGNPYPSSALGYLEASVVCVQSFESHNVYFGVVSDAVELQSHEEVLSVADTRMNYGG